jgi:hypothetical protein
MREAGDSTALVACLEPMCGEGVLVTWGLSFSLEPLVDADVQSCSP